MAEEYMQWMAGWLFRTVLLSLPLGALFVFARRRSARFRYQLLSGALMCLLVLPAAWSLLPKISLNWLPEGVGLSFGSDGAMADSGWHISALIALGWLWIAGVLVISIRLGCALRIVSGWRKRSRHWMGWTLPGENGARVLISDEIDRPLAMGLLSPVILLPLAAEQWSASRLKMVLMHEQAHIDRRDLWYQWMGRIACVVYWFHPLVWWLAKQLIEVRELATDALVVERLGGDGRGYAMELVSLAEEGIALVPRAGSSAGRLAAAAMAGESASALERRVRSLLAKRSGKGKPGIFLSAGILSVMLLAMLTLCCCVPSRHSTSVWTDEEVQMRLSADPFPG